MLNFIIKYLIIVNIIIIIVKQIAIEEFLKMKQNKIK